MNSSLTIRRTVVHGLCLGTSKRDRFGFGAVLVEIRLVVDAHWVVAKEECLEVEDELFTFGEEPPTLGALDLALPSVPSQFVCFHATILVMRASPSHT